MPPRLASEGASRLPSPVVDIVVVVVAVTAVLSSALVQTAHAQSYHFLIGHHQRSLDGFYREKPRPQAVHESNQTDAQSDGANSTIIVVQNTVHEGPADISQTAMDVITIIWYVATFVALGAFFLLMACSDRRCGQTRRRHGRTNAHANANEPPIDPPTPSPSYSEFAPPSYESVVKAHLASKGGIFVIPFAVEAPAAKDGHNNSSSGGSQSSTPTTPTAIAFYTVNELPKLSS